jgi:hypothetical protein
LTLKPVLIIRIFIGYDEFTPQDVALKLNPMHTLHNLKHIDVEAEEENDDEAK